MKLCLSHRTLGLTACLLAGIATSRAAVHVPQAFTGAAIQQAINNACASTNGGVVSLQAGTYYVPAPLTFPPSPASRTIRVVGAGKTATVVKFQQAGVNGFDFTFTARPESVQISDLTLQADAACGKAVRFSYNLAQGDENVESDLWRHVHPGPTLRNVLIGTAGAGKSFSRGVELNWAYNSRILDCEFAGAGASNGTAVYLDTGRGMNSFIRNCQIRDWHTAVEIADPGAGAKRHEGVWVSGNAITGVKRGVYYDSGGNVTFGHLNICENSITTTGNDALGILVRPTFATIVRGNTVETGGQATNATGCYAISIGGEWNTIAENTCRGNGRSGGIAVMPPPVYTGQFEGRATGNIVAKNTVTSMVGHYLWLQPNANYNKVVDNSLQGVAPLNDGSNNVIASNY
jgi:hypothetical protein